VKLIRLPFYFLGLFPYDFVHATLGRLLYFKISRIFKYRQQVIIQNLSRAFPEKNYGEIKSIAREFYRYFGTFLIDSIYLFSWQRHVCLKRVNFANVDLLQPYVDDNRQIVCLLGHYGNWEYLNALPHYLPCPVNAAYKPLSNRLIDRMMLDVRGRFGLRLIPDKQILRCLLKQKGTPQFSFFIADQFPGRNQGFPVQFLNQPTTMFSGAEKIARVLDAVVCYLDMHKDEDGIWNMRFSILSESGAASAPGEITQKFAEALEQSIVADPAIWLWSHKRWK